MIGGQSPEGRVICACCGELAVIWWSRDNGRCKAHEDRNPCIVEGCRRTRAANGHPSINASICGEHWKRYVPPRSPERRTILRLIRLAKRAGCERNDRWPEHLERRYWTAWAAIIRRVRSRSSEGHIDEAEINRIMGWE